MPKRVIPSPAPKHSPAIRLRLHCKTPRYHNRKTALTCAGAAACPASQIFNGYESKVRPGNHGIMQSIVLCSHMLYVNCQSFNTSGFNTYMSVILKQMAGIIKSRIRSGFYSKPSGICDTSSRGIQRVGQPTSTHSRCQKSISAQSHCRQSIDHSKNVVVFKGSDARHVVARVQLPPRLKIVP